MTGRVGDDVEQAVAILRGGGLVAFPTETVYGLGADATDAAAVGRIFRAKGRPADHPLIVHLGPDTPMDPWVLDVPLVARLLAEAFWPGPLTLVLARSSRVPDPVTGGRPTVGLRVPDHPVARELLAGFGGGVAAPSANRFGHVSPTTAADVVADLGDVVDYVLDGGPCRVGVESTIVDCSGDEPELLRPGGVSLERLTEVLGAPPRLWLGDSPARAPGMLAAHYAPRARVEVVADEAAARARVVALVAADGGRGRIAVLAPAPLAGLDAAAGDGDVVELEPAGPPDDYARVLYARLRQADRLGASVVVAVEPPPVGVGLAVRDRLTRAGASSSG
jgi:L-threonylcarbamoyladenylate synthase